jgi:hypothetical protein
VTLAGIGYAAALALAALLVLAAVAKMLAPEDSRRSFRQLGVPNADAAARLVPLPELAVAVLLVVVPAVGGLAALTLLAFFSTFVVTRVRAGVIAPCACFGAASAQPLSWWAVGRNAAMGVLAVAALATLHPVRPTVGDVVVVVVYVLLAAVVLQWGERSRAAHG